MEKVEITQVKESDTEELQLIGKQTFQETFSDKNSEEDMQKYLKEVFSLTKLTNEIQDKNTLFYFAKRDKKVIGYLKLNIGKSQTELKDEKAIEIERIYVLKDFYGKQVGQLLFNKAIEISLQKKANYIWLGVWEENPRAINFYKKNGFVAFDKHLFKLGNDKQTDIMMKLKLQ